MVNFYKKNMNKGFEKPSGYKTVLDRLLMGRSGNNKIPQKVSKIFAFIVVMMLSLVSIPPAQAQQYNILIKGGQVIAPKNGINSEMDVAVKDGLVALVGDEIPASDSEKVVDATGFYVTPGLIDMHAHVFVGSGHRRFADGFYSISPDNFTFRSGVTTIVDGGTSGWRNFSQFKEQVIDESRTRILAFLNIAGSGMTGYPYEQDVGDMDPYTTSLVMQRNQDIIVGTKIGHFHGSQRAPFDRAMEAAASMNKPLLVECHLPELPLEELLRKMRLGDIITHTYNKVSDRESIIDEQGNIRSYVWEAREKGVLFDVGHGGAGFHYSEALPALEQGFYPDSFGTDFHRFSMNAGMKDMLNVMSKFLNLGMDLEDIITNATWNSATSIKREDLGHLSKGAVADIAVLRLREGDFGFLDAHGYRIDGTKKLETELTIRAGQVVWDLNGIAAPIWTD
jgi:dihydroorotase